MHGSGAGRDSVTPIGERWLTLVALPDTCFVLQRRAIAEPILLLPLLKRVRQVGMGIIGRVSNATRLFTSFWLSGHYKYR